MFRFYVRAAGNVGIGTIAPVAKLHVLGNLQLPSAAAGTSGNLLLGGNTANGTNGLRLFSLDSAGGAFIDAKVSTSTNGIKFRVDTVNGSVDRMIINANGNVGIGTTTPTKAKVEISGIELLS